MKNFILVFVMICSISLTAQTEYVHRYVGLGYKLGMFQVSELNAVMPVNRFMLNVDPVKNFRLDVQYGINNSTTAFSPTPSVTLNPATKSSLMLFGAFGQYWFNDMLMYCGVRFGNSVYSNQNTNYNGSVWYLETNKGKVSIVSPVLGAEYRFGTRFSVGAEGSFMIMHDTYTSSNGSPDQKSKYTLVETSAFFRFFPF